VSNGTPAKAKPRPREIPPVDYGELTDSIGFQLRRAQLAAFGELIETLSPLELRPAQFSVLVLIAANPDLPQSNLSAALGIQRPNFVAMLDELEARGLTKRCVSATDRRSNTLTLTPEGRRVLRRAVDLHSAFEARLFKRMGSSGREQLNEMLSKLVDPGPIA